VYRDLSYKVLYIVISFNNIEMLPKKHKLGEETSEDNFQNKKIKLDGCWSANLLCENENDKINDLLLNSLINITNLKTSGNGSVEVYEKSENEEEDEEEDLLYYTFKENTRPNYTLQPKG